MVLVRLTDDANTSDIKGINALKLTIYQIV